MSNLSRLFGFRPTSPVASGLYWSGIWLALGALALSIALASTSLSENGLLPWVFTVHGFASFAGGFAAARKSGKRGWTYGLSNGLLYTILLLIVSFLATDAAWTSAVAVLFGVTALSGAFGGMLGVNTGSRRI